MVVETGVHSSGLPQEEELPTIMTHTMRERLSEKNGPRKTVFGVLSNKKYEVRGLFFLIYLVYSRCKEPIPTCIARKRYHREARRVTLKLYVVGWGGVENCMCASRAR